MQIVNFVKAGTVLTVITSDGKVITSTDANPTEVMALYDKGETTLEELTRVMFPNDESAETNKLIEDVVESSENVKVVDKMVYLGDNPVPLPEFILKQFKESSFDEDRLAAFWNKAVLNPNTTARTSLFKHLDSYGFNISESGNFIAYRNVNWTSKYTLTTEEVGEILKRYIKAVRNKKSTSVEYTSSRGRTMTLREWFNSITLHSKYDSKFTYTINEVASIPRSECDESEATCSRGLHLAGASWLERNYFGSLGLVCICNPRDVVSAPMADSYGKVRTCRLLPVDVVTWDEDGNIIQYDQYNKMEDKFDDITLDEVLSTLEEKGYDTKDYVSYVDVSATYISAEEAGEPVETITVITPSLSGSQIMDDISEEEEDEYYVYDEKWVEEDWY